MLVYLIEHLEVSSYLTYKCGFYSPITLIQSGQTHKQTNIEQSSFNNTNPSDWVALRPLFVRVRHYVTQLTAALRPYPPSKNH